MKISSTSTSVTKSVLRSSNSISNICSSILVIGITPLFWLLGFPYSLGYIRHKGTKKFWHMQISDVEKGKNLVRHVFRHIVPTCSSTCSSTHVRHVFFSSNFSSMQKKRARHCPTLLIINLKTGVISQEFLL